MLALKASYRLEQGKRAKRVRARGFLPSVVYGPKQENENIAVPAMDFDRVYREAGETSLIQLDIEPLKGGAAKKVPVLIYDIMRDPVTLKPIHADFYAVDLKKAIHARVPIVLTGEAPAVKTDGALILKVMQDIEVEALPQDLPHEISVSIEPLTAIGGRITVSMISLPDGVKTKAHEDDIIAIAEAPRAEEGETVAPAEGIVEVKTEQEIKRAEAEAKKKEEELAES